MMLLSDNGVWRMDFEQSRVWAQRAYARAEAEGDPGLITAAAAGLSLACALAGHVEEGRRVRDEVASKLDAMSDREAAASLISLSQLASGELYLDRIVEGAAHSARSVELARATKQVQLFPMLEPARGIFLGYLGRLEDSRALLDGACEAGRLGGDSHALAWGLFTRGMTLRQLGDLDAAIADGEEALELSRRSDTQNVVSLFAGLTLGVALLERGEAGRAIEIMCGCAGGPALPLAPGAMRGYYLGFLAQAYVANGCAEEAAATVAEAAAVAEATGLVLPAMAAERAAAHMALASGDPAEAARRALASAEMADALGTPIEAAQSRLLAGRGLAGADRPDAAVEVLQQAASAFDALGALRYRDEAERELRRFGSRRPHRRTRAGQRDATGVESLTERELQVARLIVDRRTNPQIAAELFLSTKTVESHVRNLFHKLGVSSRVEVARVIERADAGGDPVRLTAP
jgi:DNA-binding CsgD family transcriptional regulator